MSDFNTYIIGLVVLFQLHASQLYQKDNITNKKNGETTLLAHIAEDKTEICISCSFFE
jgi:hypothetical protein